MWVIIALSTLILLIGDAVAAIAADPGESRAIVAEDTSEARSAVCVVLCGNCRGVAVFSENVCTCTISRNFDVESHRCYEEARARAKFHHIGWRIVTSNIADNSHKITRYGQPLIPNRLAQHVQQAHSPDALLRRSPRSAPQLLYYPGAGVYGGRVSNSALLSSVPTRNQAAVYHFEIGNSKEDTVQLVFPDSGDGLEIHHQYVFHAPDGPHRSPVGESSQELNWSDAATVTGVGGSDDTSDSEYRPTVFPRRNYPYENSREASIGSSERGRSRSKHVSYEDDDRSGKRGSWSVEQSRSWEIQRSDERSSEKDYSYQSEERGRLSKEMYSREEDGYDYATASMAEFTSPPAKPS